MQPLHQGQSSLRPCSIDMELRGYEPSKPFVAKIENSKRISQKASPKRKPFLMVRIKEATDKLLMK